MLIADRLPSSVTAGAGALTKPCLTGSHWNSRADYHCRECTSFSNPFLMTGMSSQTGLSDPLADLGLPWQCATIPLSSVTGDGCRLTLKIADLRYAKDMAAQKKRREEAEKGGRSYKARKTVPLPKPMPPVQQWYSEYWRQRSAEHRHREGYNSVRAETPIYLDRVTKGYCLRVAELEGTPRVSRAG